MHNISLSFGKRIRTIRMSKNMSQEKLAELSGLHPTYIGQIERGEKSPTLDSIYKISIGLNITLSKMFYNMDNISESQNDDYALKLYNNILNLSESEKEKIYKIVCEIINL